MADICRTCKRELAQGVGCVHFWIFHKGKRYRRIKVGGKGDFAEGEDKETSWCGRCVSKMGQYHHAGCVCERCPVCRGQLISCDCFDDEGSNS